MRRHKKKIFDRMLSVFLAILMTVNLLPLTMQASGNEADIVEEQETHTSDVLSASTLESKTVNATAEGSGTVKLNNMDQSSVTVNKDTEISIEITPVDIGSNKTYISSLKINGQEQQVEKYASYVTPAFMVNEDTIIEVIFVTEYTISGQYGMGGMVYFDSQPLTDEYKWKTVDEGTVVNVQVTPDHQYQIKSIKINGAEETISDPVSYRKDITVNQNVVMEVVFERIYTLNISYEGADGSINADSSCQGGSIQVAEGSDYPIMAVPNPHYRVSKVVKNGEELLLGRKNLTEKTPNDYIYSDTSITSIDQDYSYEISFALNYYVISAACSSNGKVSFSAAEPVSSIEAEYGSNAALIITPEENYRVKGILVKNTTAPQGLSVDLEHDTAYVENLDGTSTYTVENITEAVQIEVEFEEMESLSNAVSNYADLKIISGELKNSYTDESGNVVYIFSKSSEAAVEPVSPYNQISIKYDGKNSYEAWQDSAVLTASCQITGLRVRTEKKQNAANVSMDKKIIIVLDNEAPSLALIPEKPHKNDYYHKDFTVDVDASDVTGGSAFSGIARVEYQVTCGTSLDAMDSVPPGQSGTLYEAQKNTKGIDKYNKTDYASYQPIVIDASVNNSDYVRLAVTVTDLSGNSVTEKKDFKINSTVPKIKIAMEETSKEGAKPGFYSTRTAVITILDRAGTFDPQAASDSVAIAAKDQEGKDITVNQTAMLSEWTTPEGSPSDVHTATVTFETDANYEWSIHYENKAGLSVDSAKDESVETHGEHVWNFTVDKKAPVESVIILDKTPWNQVLETLTHLTFGKFFGYSVSAVVEPKDDISPVDDITYYKSNDYTVPEAAQLEELYKNGEFKKEIITVSSDEAFVVYARVMDNAGNVCYISTDGAVVDLTQAEVEIAPEEANAQGFYNKDVKVDIAVNEKVITDKKFSGIQKVSYTIICDEKITKKDEILYTYDSSDPEKTVTDTGEISIDPDTGLPETFQDTIIVSSDENNGDRVQVQVTVIDNANNSITRESVFFAINNIKPTGKVTFYDEADKMTDGYGWYGKERTAEVIITDRASTFDQEAATNGIVITGKNAKGEEVVLDKTEISWSVDPQDSSRHIAAVVFADDARYEWSITYTNKADLGFTWEEAEKEGDSLSAFTVDRNKPRGTITVGETIWDKILEKLTFGLYTNQAVNVRAAAEDDTSPVTIQYYKTNHPIAMKKEDLDKQKFTDYSDFTVNSPEQFVVYLKITDYAGNYIYINSDGVIVDQKASKITLTADKPNENKIYNQDVNVAVKVEEPDVYSGIKTVEYWVESDGRQTQRKVLYSFDYTRNTGINSQGGQLTITDWSTGKEMKEELEGDVPTQAQLKKEWRGNIVVDAVKNNSSNVMVYVRTEDNAGNVSTVKSEKLDIDITRPEITVSYDNNADNGGNGYFPAERTATIQIKERTNHFKAAKAVKGIKITAVDAKGNTVETGKLVSEFKTTEGASPDEAVHRAAITYRTDANYTFAISYTDEAGNVNKRVDTGSSIAPYKFTVDRTAPTGTISSKTAEGRNDSWSRLVSRLTFGIWSKSSITVSAITDDLTSPIASVKYYKTSDTAAMTKKELSTVRGWKDFQKMAVKGNEQFTLYLKIEDKAGNITYISTNGMIVDSTKPRTESIAPEVTISPEQPINGIYNRNVKVDIKIEDPLVGGTYSGLKEISYRVLNMGTETQNGVLYSFDKTAPVQSELRREWSGSITVDSGLNNSNDVVIEVYAEDNAQNSSTKTESIKIDITKPEITVRYDNNNPDSEKYYKDSRTATIVVNERNFDPKDIVLTITNTDGAVPVMSEWTTGTGDGNFDNTPHTATVTYEADGDYTFDINYIDLAKNVCDGENYAAGTANGTEFTIDKTVPTISVSYDNNEASESKYFKAGRTATITIEEHNFDVSRVQFTQTAALDGAQIPIPTPSWSENGDTHTATISYDTDGDYTFDVTMTDMAGNESGEASYVSDTASKEFTVDTKIEKPVISGVENGKAYKGEVVPVIDFSDINYDDYSIELKRTRRDKKNEDVKDQFIKDMVVSAQGGSGTNNTFDMIKENDGIYTLEVHLKDKAGNEEKETVTFTLNRFGSVYEYSDSLLDLIQDGGAYVKEVDKDIEITEYNADKLVDGSLAIEITRDGKPIGDIDYTISPEMNDRVNTGESGWYQYSYRIAADNFKDDGVYKMTISSADETGNTPENTPENTNYEKNAVLFRVDSTKPEITSVTGLEKEVVNDTKLEVRYDIYDTIGLKSVAVTVKTEKETVIEQEITDFGQDRNNYSGSFVLPENTSAQDVRFVVYDMADNCTDTSSEDFQSQYEFYHMITVSTNFFVRWYADKVRFFGSIGGAAALIFAAAGLVFILRKRRVRAE